MGPSITSRIHSHSAFNLSVMFGALLLSSVNGTDAQSAEGLVFTLRDFLAEGAQGASLVDDRGSDRPYLKFDSHSKGMSMTLNAPIRGEFTITAWVRIREFPNGGQANFTTSGPSTIVHLEGKNEAILRVLGNQLQFTIRGDDGWKGVLGMTDLPLHQWILVSASWKQGEMRLGINGELQGALPYKGIVPVLDRLTIGRTKDRRFLGDIDEVRVYRGQLSTNQLEALFTERTGLNASKLLSWLNPPSEVSYECLKVEPGARHPIAEGLSLHAEVVAWSGDKRTDLLVSGERRFFSARQSVYAPNGKRTTQGLPVYAPGKIIALAGTNFKQIPRDDGLFDLLAYGSDTPFGSRALVRYENIGKLGAPEFAAAEPVMVAGSSLTQTLPDTPGPWALHDFNQDGTLDLLISAGSGMEADYWPYGVSVWNGQDFPNSGPSRGYDIQGNWLGDSGITKLYWASGSIDDTGKLVFDTPRPVYVGDIDFQVQWKFFSPHMVPTVTKIGAKTHIVLVGDLDRVISMRFYYRDGELRTEPARALLKDEARLKEMYWTNSITSADLDNDGLDELVLSGNPGRIVVLKGSKVGEFEEVGSLTMEGGPLGVDTLVTPTRGDWDGDPYPDLICGDASGWLTYWPGTKDPLVYAAPKYLHSSEGIRLHHQAGETGSIQGPNEARWGYTQPALGDWDGDGVNELVVNDINATIMLYKKTAQLDRVEGTKFTLKNQRLPAAWRARPIVLPAHYGHSGDERPSLLYLDWDGDLSLALPDSLGSKNLVETEKLFYDDGEPVRLSGVRGHWGRAKLAIADWDNDGRWDLVWGQNAGVNRYIWQGNPPAGATVCWLRNVGTNSAPRFERLRPIPDKNGDLLDFKVHNSSVWPTDLDNDGELDLLVGAEDGKVYYFFHNELSAPQEVK